MLVISRKVGESLMIGDNIKVTVVKVAGGGVRLGIDAPSGVMVVRKELKDSSESTDGPPRTKREAAS